MSPRKGPEEYQDPGELFEEKPPPPKEPPAPVPVPDASPVRAAYYKIGGEALWQIACNEIDEPADPNAVCVHDAEFEVFFEVRSASPDRDRAMSAARALADLLNLVEEAADGRQGLALFEETPLRHRPGSGS